MAEEIQNQRAQVLIEALPHIQKYYGKTVVVKYGGNAMINETLKDAVIHDIVLLSLVGVRVVVVHGGGPEISGMLKKIGEEACETVMAAKDEDREKIIYECADLWFHTMVMLSYYGLRPEDITAELARREGLSGLAEKASRPKD